MGFLSFTAWQYAAAGALLAAGPLIIHLLNRRRYRVVKWAAMDFLKQALERNRRILQIRDIVLLVLRTAAVLLFGLAMARPYFAARQEAFDDRQPLHAVIVIDNSLSMAYESLEGTLLDKAKDRARQLIDKLPAGSRTSVIPACGGREVFSLDPYETKESASEAVERIETVDRTASVVRTINEVRRACETAPDLAKRIVFIGDQQALNWRDVRESPALKDLPPAQFVSVAPIEWENTWISDVRIQDGLADVETPATVIVEIRHQGESPRRDLVVTLRIGETVVGEKTVTVEPGLGAREVDFECTFGSLTQLPEPDKPVFVALEARLAPDRLAADDQRFTTVPVVAALPVVFIDQYGPAQEDVVQGRLGETRHLRKLLAPKTSRVDAPRQLIQVRHITPGELTRDILADSRLVVIAGLREPGEMTPLLREYVQQGGQLFIAAGADFDPAVWNEAAWLGGQGILPLPVSREALGQTPEEGGPNVKPFFLSFDSLAREEYFQLAGVAESELRELYAEPFFFKAVNVDASAQATLTWNEAERAKIVEELDLLAAIEKRREAVAAAESRGAVSEEERRLLAEDERRLATLLPAWLVWASPQLNVAVTADSTDSEATPRESRIKTLLLARAPRVLARYELAGAPPFLASRRIGNGEVIFCSSGILSSWNTLPKTNAVLLFDRILRGMIQNTLPRRNLIATDRLAVPLPAAEQNLQVTLKRPDRQREEALDVGYLGPDTRGVTLSGLLTRGVYRVRGFRPPTGASQKVESETAVWDVPLVVNGEAEESNLTALSRGQFSEIAQDERFRWVGRGEEISLAGAAIRGQNSWWWMALVVLLLLFVEMSVLAWPSMGGAAASSQAAGT